MKQRNFTYQVFENIDANMFLNLSRLLQEQVDKIPRKYKIEVELNPMERNFDNKNIDVLVFIFYK